MASRFDLGLEFKAGILVEPGGFCKKFCFTREAFINEGTK